MLYRWNGTQFVSANIRERSNSWVVLPTPLYDSADVLQPDPYQYQLKWIYLPNSSSTTAYITSTHPFSVNINFNGSRWNMTVANYNLINGTSETIGIRRYNRNKSVTEDSTTDQATNILVTNLENVAPELLETSFDIYSLSGTLMLAAPKTFKFKWLQRVEI